jgi:hypothetical protein
MVRVRERSTHASRSEESGRDMSYSPRAPSQKRYVRVIAAENFSLEFTSRSGAIGQLDAKRAMAIARNDLARCRRAGRGAAALGDGR